MRVGFIVVTYNTSDAILTHIKSQVDKLGFKDLRFYVCDNTFDNKGFATGVNSSIKKGVREGVDIFIVANLDISLEHVSSEELLAGSPYFDVWGLAMWQDNRTYYGGQIDRWRMSGGLIGEKPRRRFHAVDYVTGSLMLFKKQVIDAIGLWDEGYFMYYEDVDFCYRAKKAGFKVGIDRDTTYIHFETSKTNKKKAYFLAKSRWRFFLKFSNTKQKIRELIRLPKTLYELVAK
ncbi:MAG TPA: glycosyltransferase [Patescibacteria group bacterium]|nr:glycosyltransferase [Patescibacteria group bacterium]